MTKSSNISAAQIKSLRASNRRQFNAINALLGSAASPAEQTRLLQAQIEISEQDAQLHQISAAYAASHLGQSEAEAHLVNGAGQAKVATQNLNKVTKLLNSVAATAGILTNLITIFS